MAARRPEKQALMVGSESGSDSDVTEFGPPSRKGQSRSARNGIASNLRGLHKSDGSKINGQNTKTFALAVSVIMNIVFVILLIVARAQRPPSINHTVKPSTDPGLPNPPPPNPAKMDCVTSSVTCGKASEHVPPPVDDGYVNVFKDLTSEEIQATQQYFLRQRSLSIQMSNNQGNYIASVELYVPTKTSTLDFLDNSRRQPPREALATVFFAKNTPPVVRQYVVGPLPRPTYHKINPRMTKDVPAAKFTVYRFGEAKQFIAQQTGHPEVQRLLWESFGAMSNCTGSWKDPCIMFLGQKISFGLMNRTSFCFPAYYNAEFPTIHPVPLQIVIGETQPGHFAVQFVYYAGSTFSSFAELIARYQEGSIHKVSRRYPVNVPGESSVAGSLNLRGDPFPKTPHPPPRQYEPKGSRYSIVDQHVKYLEWSFNVRNSVESGLQVWDVTWSGERIVYELSLQEIAVLYAGANPSSMFAHLSDSAFGLGDNARSLVPGVDCPEHASFMSTWILNSKSRVPKVERAPNTVCVFEHNSGIPLRRHRFENDWKTYGGLVDHYLTVRTIIVEYNYDYIVDVVFHANGAMETRVYATGYIMSQWFRYAEDPFGFNVHDDVVGSVHHHLFHFKLDMDVGGVSNRYETLDFEADERNWSWLSSFKPSALSSSGKFQQISYKHHVRKTEKDALYHYNFDTPKYHVFYTDKVKNTFGNPRAYRVEVRGFSKQFLPDAHPAVRSRKWMQQCMAVTNRKEEESKSSSVFSMYDADDPVVDFEDFYKDDESIVDKDLVTWVTVGMHHIPHTEDIPNTPTVGTEASILLLPFNYFPESPSMRSRDAVRGKHDSLDGVTRFETYGTETDFTCLPPVYSWLKQSQSTDYP
ncbi:hypothetical protein V1264_001796 [Littorina saxatilis]|uniref:Amine oxidase n=1 Tax=Littorina saxatilis TaxID=31220 RepID=A0AAN9GP87_9CAEN